MNSDSSNKQSGKLSLLDACAMAIGGMVGGGIFAVLGEAVGRAGNAAFIAFILAGLLALLTGVSYSRLTLDFDEPGGSFTFVEKLAGARAAGTVSWFLLLGYVFTLSLYAHTFGVYAARLLGLGEGWDPVLGGAIVVALAGLNLGGVHESGVAEDVLVYLKVAILLFVAGVGFFAVQGPQALPVLEFGVSGIVSAAALIFVAYEGFELLTYDYDDIKENEKNLPRAIWISIPAVIVIYILVSFVTTGSVSNDTVSQHEETVLAYVAQPILGRVGFVAVLVAAVFSTASAINATLFASARLAKRVTSDHQLPPGIARWQRSGVPVVYILISAGSVVVVQALGNLGQITTFSSLVFLSVYAVVNLSAIIHRSYRGWRLAFPTLGFVGCLLAAGMLAFSAYQTNPTTLWLILGVAVVLLALRILFFFHPHFRARSQPNRK